MQNSGAPCGCSAIFLQKTLCEKDTPERPQTFRGTEIKNQISWSMAKAHAAAISNRFQQPSFSASLRPMSTPMTEAIISPRVQPEESPKQCRP